MNSGFTRRAVIIGWGVALAWALSAVIGCASDRRHGKPLAMHIAHNPLETVTVPQGIYDVDGDEWFATPAADAPGEFYFAHS
jgi:hypothetical protein